MFSIDAALPQAINLSIDATAIFPIDLGPLWYSARLSELDVALIKALATREARLMLALFEEPTPGGRHKPW